MTVPSSWAMTLPLSFPHTLGQAAVLELNILTQAQHFPEPQSEAASLDTEDHYD